MSTKSESDHQLKENMKKMFSRQNLSQDGIIKMNGSPTMYMYTSITM